MTSGSDAGLNQIPRIKKIIVFHVLIMFGISPMTTEFFIARRALLRRKRLAILQFSSRRVIKRYVKPQARSFKIRWRCAVHASNCQVPCVLSCCTSQVSTRTATTLHLAQFLLPRTFTKLSSASLVPLRKVGR